MKLKSFTMILLTALGGVLFNACEMEQPALPLNIASVKFAASLYTIEKSSDHEQKVILPLSVPLEEAGSIVVSVDAGSTADAADFTTDPEISSGAMTLNLGKGALEASFTVTSSGDFDENETIIFKLTSATGGIKLANADTVVTVIMEGNNPTIPEVITSVNSLTGFGSVKNGKVSASTKSYTVQGSGLHSDIIVYAPDNFEVSLDNTTFSKTVTIDYHDAATTPTDVFVRFAPASGANQELKDSIINYSDGAGEKKVAVSGTETGNITPGGTLILSEDFDYGTSAGDDLKELSDGSWAHYSGVTPVQYLSSGLTFAGYAGSGKGGAAYSENGGGSREDLFMAFDSQSSGTIYIAQLLNVAAAGDGDFFTSLRNSSAKYFNRLYAKTEGGNLMFGLGRSSADAAFAPTTYSLGTTYLVVTKYDFASGVSSLFVLDGTIPASEPDANATTTDGSAGPDAVQDIIIRQGTGSLSVTLDGIRIATTWSAAVGL